MQTTKLEASVLVYASTVDGESELPARPAVYRLEDNSSAIVGSDATCRIRLENEQIEPRHVMIRLDQGDVFVSDWFTDSGTRLNGVRLQEPTQIQPTDRVGIGNLELQIVVHPVGHTVNPNDPTASATPMESAAAPIPQNRQPLPVALADNPNESRADNPDPDPLSQPATVDPDVIQAASSSDTALPSDTDTPETRVTQSNEVLDQSECGAAEAGAEQFVESAYQAALDDAETRIQKLEQELAFLQSLAPEVAAHDEFAAEELELLREERVLLQNELELKEQEIAELQQQTDRPDPCDEPSETLRLVQRLEDLLEELQQADQRVLGLEELLRISDEACQAERETHQRVEEWISQLEQRVSDRDQEWLAREEKLHEKLRTSQQRVKLCEDKLREHIEAAQDGDRSDDRQSAAVCEKQIVLLQQQQRELQDQLESAREQNSLLEQQLHALQDSQADLEELDQLRNRLRASELEIAEQNARLFRQRAEYERTLEQLGAPSTGPQPLENDSDNLLKLREFRNHLKEIHQQEKQQRQETSLASRISRLWNRLDRR